MQDREIAWLLEEKYNGVECDAFIADRTALLAGTPLAYLIGHVPFLDTTIYLANRPLIPRPETEYWTERAITEIQQRVAAAPARVLDLCAGSGAIGVAVAHAIPDALVTLSEIDPVLIATIQKNSHENLSPAVRAHTSIIQSDLFQDLTGSFDFILTNPPYIDATANTVDANVVMHEPHRALFGGVDGMELIATIITEAPQYLTPDGQLWIEHEPFQAAAIGTVAATHGFAAHHHTDQYGTVRYSVLTLTVPK